jgi:hypothetical protein
MAPLQFGSVIVIDDEDTEAHDDLIILDHGTLRLLSHIRSMFMSLISVHYNSSSSWLQLFYEQLKMRQNLKPELHGFLGILWQFLDAG